MKAFGGSSLPHPGYRRTQGALGDHGLPKFLEHIVILCFERRYPKQNRVFQLKSNILVCPKFFWPPNFGAGYATAPGMERSRISF